jgi:hypothetical protein
VKVTTWAREDGLGDRTLHPIIKSGSAEAAGDTQNLDTG